MTRDVTPLVEAWLHEPAPLSDRGIARVGELVHQTPQRRGWLPRYDPVRLPSMFTAAKFVTAGIIVALFSGALYLGITPPPPDEVPVNAATSVSPTATAEATVTASAVPTATADPGPSDPPEPAVREEPAPDRRVAQPPGRFEIPRIPESNRRARSGRLRTPLGPARWLAVSGTAETLPGLSPSSLLTVPGGYAHLQTEIGDPPHSPRLWFSPNLIKWKKLPVPADAWAEGLVSSDRRLWLTTLAPDRADGMRLWHSTDARSWEEADLTGLVPPEPSSLEWTMDIGDVAAVGDRAVVEIVFEVSDLASVLGIESRLPDGPAGLQLHARGEGSYHVEDSWGQPLADIRFDETTDGLVVIDSEDGSRLTTIREFGMDVIDRWASVGRAIEVRLALVGANGATYLAEPVLPGLDEQDVTHRRGGHQHSTEPLVAAFGEGGRFTVFLKGPDDTMETWLSEDGMDWRQAPVATDSSGKPLGIADLPRREGPIWTVYSTEGNSKTKRWVSEDGVAWRRRPIIGGYDWFNDYSVEHQPERETLAFTPARGGEQRIVDISAMRLRSYLSFAPFGGDVLLGAAHEPGERELVVVRLENRTD